MIALNRIGVVSEQRSELDYDHPLSEWSVLEWAGAASGEAGEATNVAKKMSRFDKGFSIARARAGMSRDELKVLLAKEMADTIHYYILLARSESIDLEKAIVDRFNEKSVEIGSTYVLGPEYLA